MRTFALAVTSALLLAATSGFAQSMPATPVSMEFSHVLATVELQPGQTASVTVPDAFFASGAPGSMTIYIPAGAFKDPVRFQLLAATNAHWDAYVGKDLKAVANFAYRVMDLKTGKLVTSFAQPLQYTVSDSMIDANSVYWAVKPGTTPTLVNANKASDLHGTVLSHPTPTPAVGWVITTPRSDLKAMMAASGGAMSTSTMGGGASGMSGSGSSGNGM